MTTDRQMEQAARIEELERTAGRASIARALLGCGNDDCADCGDPIPAARRAAAPWATRCADCQSDYESKQKRGITHG